MDKHVELLREMVADFSPPGFKLERAALTAAIAALEAVGNAQLGIQDRNSGRTELTNSHEHHTMPNYRHVLIIPADAVEKEPTNDN